MKIRNLMNLLGKFVARVQFVSACNKVSVIRRLVDGVAGEYERVPSGLLEVPREEKRGSLMRAAIIKMRSRDPLYLEKKWAARVGTKGPLNIIEDGEKVERSKKVRKAKQAKAKKKGGAKR